MSFKSTDVLEGTEVPCHVATRFYRSFSIEPIFRIILSLMYTNRHLLKGYTAMSLYAIRYAKQFEVILEDCPLPLFHYLLFGADQSKLFRPHLQN